MRGPTDPLSLNLGGYYVLSWFVTRFNMYFISISPQIKRIEIMANIADIMYRFVDVPTFNQVMLYGGSFPWKT